MKTARKQELRTNDLAEQIAQLGEYSRQYGKSIAIGAVVVAIVAVAVFAYVRNRNSAVERGWSDYWDARTISAASAADQIQYYRAIAERGVDPVLSAWSYLRMGSTAMNAANDPKLSATEQADMAKRSAEYFEKVSHDFPTQVIPAGVAEISLGVLAENRRDFAAARQIFQRIIDDPRFAMTPARGQAEYRLKNLDQWTAAVEFPPPVPVSQPAAVTTSPVATTMPAEPAEGGMLTPGTTGGTVETHRVDLPVAPVPIVPTTQPASPH